jgi:hypothetical protein
MCNADPMLVAIQNGKYDDHTFFCLMTMKNYKSAKADISSLMVE